ncbi:ACT domain-containing protein [Marinobacter salinus]|uniref:ACT domain-containing protein n=1 Tax=Marinobacter salinus TaxID=1874317 RepID=UPI001D0D63F1|nr:ACT domain-containing protein [Marinobacter salinus]
MSYETAALERLCQVVRIRGFRIAKMAVESAGEHLDIMLTLEGTRPIAMLQAQLEKLHTVTEVALGTQGDEIRSTQSPPPYLPHHQYRVRPHRVSGPAA